MCSLNAQVFSGGSGTKDDPYRISNKKDMDELAFYSVDHSANPNAPNHPYGQYWTYQKYFIITNDIREPVTESIRQFRGSFDGQGYKIVIKLERYIWGGLFNILNDAVIKNIVVDGTQNRKVQSDWWREGIIGTISIASLELLKEQGSDGTYNVTVKNCINMMQNFYGDSTNTIDSTTGIVGFISYFPSYPANPNPIKDYNMPVNIVIEDCINLSSIAKGYHCLPAYKNSGGIVRHCWGIFYTPFPNKINVSINKSINSGFIEGNDIISGILGDIFLLREYDTDVKIRVGNCLNTGVTRGDTS